MNYGVNDHTQIHDNFTKCDHMTKYDDTNIVCTEAMLISNTTLLRLF